MGNKKEWTDEDIQNEIKEAVRIVSEDRDRVRYNELHSRFGNAEPPKPGSGEAPPPKTEDADPAEAKKSKSLWWGEVEE